MGRKLLKLSAIRTGALLAGFAGSLTIHSPMAQGGVAISNPKYSDVQNSLNGAAKSFGMANCDGVFVTHARDVDGNGFWNVRSDCTAVAVTEIRLASFEADSALLAVPAPHALPDGNGSMTDAASSTMLASGDAHWLPFEKRWFSPQSLLPNDASPSERVPAVVLPIKQPAKNSSPIPLLPATKSALAFASFVCVFATAKRVRRAFR